MSFCMAAQLVVIMVASTYNNICVRSYRSCFFFFLLLSFLFLPLWVCVSRGNLPPRCDRLGAHHSQNNSKLYMIFDSIIEHYNFACRSIYNNKEHRKNTHVIFTCSIHWRILMNYVYLSILFCFSGRTIVWTIILIARFDHIWWHLTQIFIKDFTALQ